MPIRVDNIAAVPGSTFIDIRVGRSQGNHQVRVQPSLLGVAGGASISPGGSLPPGLPILRTGAPVSAPGQSAWLIGPEAVLCPAGAGDFFANAFISGDFNRQAIEDNLGRVLTADELSALLAAGLRVI